VNRLKRGCGLKEKKEMIAFNKKLQVRLKSISKNPSACTSKITKDLNYDVSIRAMRRALKELGSQHSSTLKFL